MIQGDGFNEPEVDPLADTNPTMPVREETGGGWRRLVGLFSLLAAAGFTIATIVILMTPDDVVEPPVPSPQPTNIVTLTQNPTTPPTDAPATATRNSEPIGDVAALPTISPEQSAALLAVPLASMGAQSSVQISRNLLEAFTIIPDRPRSEVIEYEVVRGDTIYSIAQRFGLKPETIAWSNDRRIIQLLSPGDKVSILPVDGVYHTAIGSKTIAEIAAAYKVDPYAIIDSEYNNLFGATPDMVPPSGTRLVIPGGQAEEITWNPTVVREGGDGSGGSSGGAYITFAPGQEGSCGRVLNPGGGAYWANPLPQGTYTRGFSSWHTGIDLAAAVDTPVHAANGGRVIFAGWNSWGYGYTIVLAHGPYTTLYGHLNSIYVGCKQDVTPGQIIGGVGSSGNSTGPHLHFEIRFNDVPYDPAATIGF